jgi:hypothetical protein
MYMAQAERLVGAFVETAIPKQPIAAIVVDPFLTLSPSFQGRTFNYSNAPHAGQVRELLDIFGWALPFDGCASRPTEASYSSSSSFLTAAICRRSNSVTLTERHRSAARMRGAEHQFQDGSLAERIRDDFESAALKGLGVRPGVPDVIAVHEGRYSLEVNAPGGRSTQAQLASMAAMQATGGFCCIAEGRDPALAAFKVWGLLRGRASITTDKQSSR